MTEVDLAYLAGLLEGEGCFSIKKSGKYLQPCIQLNMTDEDVIHNAAKLAGCGKVTGPYSYNLKPDWSPTWRWNVYKNQQVYDLCKELYPYMGLRRQQSIGKILSVLEDKGFESLNTFVTIA